MPQLRFQAIVCYEPQWGWVGLEYIQSFLLLKKHNSFNFRKQRLSVFFYIFNMKYSNGISFEKCTLKLLCELLT